MLQAFPCVCVFLYLYTGTNELWSNYSMCENKVHTVRSVEVLFWGTRKGRRAGGRDNARVSIANKVVLQSCDKETLLSGYASEGALLEFPTNRRVSCVCCILHPVAQKSVMEQPFLRTNDP